MGFFNDIEQALSDAADAVETVVTDVGEAIGDAVEFAEKPRHCRK
ncbi:MAG: hypothetical protein AB4290_13970 [Spirulina sp.]